MHAIAGYAYYRYRCSGAGGTERSIAARDGAAATDIHAYCNADTRGADTCNGYTKTNGDTKTNGYADGYPNAATYAYPYRNSHPGASDTGNCDAITHADCDCYAYPDGYCNAGAAPNRGFHPQANSDRSADTRANKDAHVHSDTNPDTHRNPDFHVHADIYA